MRCFAPLAKRDAKARVWAQFDRLSHYTVPAIRRMMTLPTRGAVMSEVFVAKPATRKPANISLAELIAGIRSYLMHTGIEAGRVSFSPFYRSQDIGTNGTTIELHEVIENGEPWETGRYIFFEIYEKACKVATSKIGSGPFDIFLIATIERDRPEAGCRVVADFMVEVQPDRSLACRPRVPPRRYAPNG